MMQGIHHHHHNQFAAFLTAALPKDDAKPSSSSTTPEEDEPRLAALNSLHRAIIYPPNSLLVTHSASFLAQGFSQLLTDNIQISRRMSSSEAETDISDSELEEYVDRCYLHLKEFGDTTVRFSDELFRCPYCPGKKKLVYAVKDHLQHATDVGKGSQNRDIKHKGKHLGLVRYIKTDLDGDDVSLEFSGLHLGKAPVHGLNELFVWPCMGVLESVDDKWSISTIKNDTGRSLSSLCHRELKENSRKRG